MNKIEINTQFEYVLNFVNQTNQSIFLTGKAGTGKTTLLKYIREYTVKQMAVVAPTGVAAINAGGSTIHSFFQFPFSPFLPALNDAAGADLSRNNLPNLKHNAQRLSLFRRLELLVIDEISMVRADLLDQIDQTLRHTRKKWHQAFGGVQVLLIGDMHQLPPVVQPEEWKLLSTVYKSLYFFDSLVMHANKPVYIELEKIYRQKEQRFIDILNKVRNNHLAPGDFDLLNQHYRPALSQEFIRSNITLTTHNRKADDINQALLSALPDQLHSFKCKVEGLFNEKSYPAEEELLLKKGARVMFLKNNAEKNYYNGKIGLVTFLHTDKIRVLCEEDQVEIEVAKETWNNISYSVNKGTKSLEEEVVGTFSQFPLRLAWAITIHKSQGLSFDNVIIDAAQSFSAGQVYVALSRCRGLSGLTLSSRIGRDSLFNDKNIEHFSSAKPNEGEVQSLFNRSRALYIKTLLLSLFDFSEAMQSRQELAGLLQAFKTRIHQKGQDWCLNFFSGLENLHQVGNKFRAQLGALLDASRGPEEDANLQTRVKQAVSYFYTELDGLLSCFRALPAFTESKEAAEEINAELQKVFEELFTKNALLAACNQGFHLETFLSARLKINYPSAKINVYENARNTATLSNLKHPDLYKQLLFLRDEICQEEHKPIYLVANGKTLKELADFLPTTPGQLLKISGFGEARVEAYGTQFLSLIKDYVREHNLSTDILAFEGKQDKKKKKEKQSEGQPEKKTSSKEQTFDLFKQGLSMQEIALVRKFSISTLEGHLLPYVASGEINIDKVVESEKQKVILKVLENFKKEAGLGAIKNSLPAEISYSELKYMLAYIKLKN